MPTEVLTHLSRARILNKPMQMQLIGDAQPFERRERRGGSRRDGGFNGERRNDRGGWQSSWVAIVVTDVVVMKITTRQLRAAVAPAIMLNYTHLPSVSI
ncbi:Cold-shock DEAD box protein A [Providencia stuartii]|nr:Cold-shock DEAD box protein A [Providencia stuartii]